MTSGLQGRRPYDATGRQAQARQSRDRVLAVARRLFVAHGFAGTSIAAIAAAAGVSTRTVFGFFGSKTNLLKEAVDAAIVGDTDPVPLAGRAPARHVHEATTAAQAVQRLADVFADINARVYDMYAVVDAAATTDPEIAELLTRLEAQRLTGAGAFAATLTDRLGTSDPAVVATVRDIVWTLGSPLQYRLLVRDRGWTLPRYRDYIARALLALVPTPR